MLTVSDNQTHVLVYLDFGCAPLCLLRIVTSSFTFETAITIIIVHVLVQYLSYHRHTSQEQLQFYMHCTRMY